MAGRRLLDAARLFDASRSIAKQHFAIRSQQWDVYTRTSTLARAVKDQTDRVTVTARAAYALSRRFDESPPSHAAQSSAHDDHEGTSIPRQETVQGSSQPLKPQEGVQQDHHYDRSRENSVLGDASHGDLEIVQEKADRHALPDGTIPTGSVDLRANSSAYDEDTFVQRPLAEPSKQPLGDSSTLPQNRIPRNAEDTQGTDEHVKDGQVNQDVFYSTRSPPQQPSIPTQEAIPEQPSLPEGINTDVFHSPRVASLLSSAGKEDRRKAYEMKMKAAKRTPLDRSPLKQGIDQDTFNVRQSGDDAAQPTVSSAPKDVEQETREFAESLARDVESSASPALENELEAASSPKTPYQLRESRVPSSRFGRLWQYGGLATSMAFGAVGESLRRVTGSGADSGSLMLSPANMERLVAKLSRMRGAALKLGQMMSFQDSKMLPPAIHAVLQRVQDSADYMPPSQRNKVLASNLGADWRDLFSSFEDVPIAAASIGQVHRAVLASTGQQVAVKIQYPGVRDSIDSDLNNLSLLLTASRLLPKGLYLDKTIANARVELGWECDYVREAEAAQRFQELMKDEHDTFTVPKIMPEGCGPQVLTLEYMTGTAVTKVPGLTQTERDWIGTQILRLCLRELMEWNFMQTDPNWTNFLYDRSSGGGAAAAAAPRLQLLDFGASRAFPQRFVEPYVRLLVAASTRDRDACRDLSIELGYLTGAESKPMLDAHIDSIFTLAEPFLAAEGGDAPSSSSSSSSSSPSLYDFHDQTITDRVRQNIGLMVRERLAPPPEETYSLHRKLSGAFLLCARLGSRVPARQLFQDAVSKWEAKHQGQA